VYVPVDEEAEEATPISSMKQEMIEKAESFGMYMYLHVKYKYVAVALVINRRTVILV